MCILALFTSGYNIVGTGDWKSRLGRIVLRHSPLPPALAAGGGGSCCHYRFVPPAHPVQGSAAGWKWHGTVTIMQNPVVR